MSDHHPIRMTSTIFTKTIEFHYLNLTKTLVTAAVLVYSEVFYELRSEIVPLQFIVRFREYDIFILRTQPKN